MNAAPATSNDRSRRLGELLASTALGDQAAFRELYRATSSQMFGVAMRIVRDTATAEEILQESYVSIWHHASSYVATKSQPLTWITAIVRNRCLDSLRRRELATVSMTPDDDELDAEFASDDRSPAELFDDGVQAQSVRDCVQALEGGSRQAIALAFFQGLSHAELAAHLHQPLGTVKSWVRRGLERLRQCLDGAGVVR